MLDEANRAHPGVWWWIKADDCNIRAGLGESVKKICSGDVDLADGKLPALYDQYIKRRAFVEGLGLEGRGGRWDISNDLAALESDLTHDMKFIAAGTYMYNYIR